MKSEFISFPLTCHQHTPPRTLKLLTERGKYSRQIWTSFPAASSVSLAARAEIQTKAIKASAIYTFPKQACGIHSPSVAWDLHGDADITELGEILPSAQQHWEDNIFFTRAPSTDKAEESSAARASLAWSHASPSLCLYQVSVSPCGRL